jgi:hypothetical protein
MNAEKSSYFKEDCELTYAALTLFSDYKRTCSMAEKVLKAEMKKLISEHELKQVRKK